MTLRAGFLGACPYPVGQGSQVFLRDHARAFREAGHEAHLITYGYGDGEDISGLPLHRCAAIPGARKTSAGPSWAKPLLDALLVKTVRRVVREEHLNVIFAHNYEALIVALAARACPVIYHAHNTMEDELPHYFGGARWAARIGRWLDRTFPRRADAVIVPHARLGECLVRCGCEERRVHVVSPPVWVEEFTRAQVGEEMPPVDYAGNLDAYQNLGLLVEAMQKVRARVPGARLRVGTNLRQDAAATLEAEIVRVGRVSELQEFLASDSVFAVPRTSWSGYPVKILNAMAAGKAIVACESAGHALKKGETGLLVPDGDAEAFAEAIVRLLTEPALRARLGIAAHAAVVRDHAPLAVGEGLAGIARDVLSPTESV